MWIELQKLKKIYDLTKEIKLIIFIVRYLTYTFNLCAENIRRNGVKMKEKNCSKNPNVYGMYIQRLAKRIKYLADDNLIKHKITLEQVKILGFLESQGESVTIYQKDIETEFGIRRSSVTNILQNIEKNGLIKREGDPADARVKKVMLTEEGKKLSRLLKDYIVNLEAVIVDGMTTEEKEQFLSYLKQSLQNIDYYSAMQ